MKPRNNGGFTLVELLVTIVVSSVVTLAATTVLLLGLRLNNQASGTVTRQNTTRILLSVLENIASEGTIEKVKSEPDSWQVIGEGDQVLLSYNAASDTVYTGTSTPLMEGVIASHMSLEGQLLTFAVETEDGTYSASVYCRMAPTDESENNVADDLLDDDSSNDNVIDDTVANREGRLAFLKALVGQRGSPGVVLVEGNLTNLYYTKWYIGDDWDKNGWGASTPWCACFISWGLAQVSDQVTCPTDRPQWYANVDDFMAYFEDTQNGSAWEKRESDYEPIPGDLIFFDWDSGTDPEHIGAVLAVSEGYVYTIEGNTAGIVAVRKYALNDPDIIGYGILDWKTATETTE